MLLPEFFLSTGAEEQPLSPVRNLIPSLPQRKRSGAGNGPGEWGSAFKLHKSQDQLKPPPPSAPQLSIRRQPSQDENPTRTAACPPSSSQPLSEREQQDEWATLLQRAMCSQTAAPAPFCSLHSFY